MKKLFSVICTIVVSASMLLCAFPVSAVSATNSAMPDLKVELIASRYSAKPGDTVKVSLAFENASAYPYGLAAFVASLSYDTTAVRLTELSVAASGSDAMSNNIGGVLKTLYSFASATKQPGFNTDGVFYTASFTVLDSATGSFNFGIDFDSINITDYVDNTVSNSKVGFSTPTVSVALDGVTSSSDDSSSAGSLSSDSSSNSAQNPNGSEASIDANTGENKNFVDVTDTGAPVISTDTFDDEGATIGSTESKSDSASSASSAGENNNAASATNRIVAVCGIAVVVIAAAAIVIVCVLRSRKKQK